MNCSRLQCAREGIVCLSPTAFASAARGTETNNIFGACVAVLLPDQLESELNLSRGRSGRGHYSGSGVRRARRVKDVGTGDERWHLEVGTIEKIERLSAELHVEPVGNVGVLHKGEVKVFETGSGEDIAPRIPTQVDARWKAEAGIAIL